jgi:hypothetical protein
MHFIIVFQQIRDKRFWESLEECTLTCKDSIQSEAFTKLFVRKTKHRDQPSP